jgi:hypothetical protein
MLLAQGLNKIVVSRLVLSFERGNELTCVKDPQHPVTDDNDFDNELVDVDPDSEYNSDQASDDDDTAMGALTAKPIQPVSVLALDGCNHSNAS